MDSFQTPFQTGWWSISLPEYRQYPQRSTYDIWQYETLPALPRDLLCGDFSWLMERGKVDERQIEMIEDEEDREEEIQTSPRMDWATRLEKIVESAAQLGLSLPPEFVTFMASRELITRIRSCTDCYFDLPAWIVAAPENEELVSKHSTESQGYVIRFLCDSQSCLQWYLYLVPSGGYCIVVSGALLGGNQWIIDQETAWRTERGEDWNYWEEDETGAETNDFWYCGANFEEFIYRFWIENEIWYALQWDKVPLTDEQQQYAEACKAMNGEKE